MCPHDLISSVEWLNEPLTLNHFHMPSLSLPKYFFTPSTTWC